MQRLLALQCWPGCYREVWYVLGHPRGDAIGESCYLFVDVHHEGVGSPPSLFFDKELITAIEFHCHCSTGAKGVAGDFVGSETTVMESKVGAGLLDSVVDMTWSDLLWSQSGVIVCGECSVSVMCVRQDMGHLTC